MRQRGTSAPVCQYAEGCRDPFPELTGLDLIAFTLFRLCVTQFEIAAGLGGSIRTRLIYSEVEIVARIHGVELTPAIFWRLRVLETAAIEIQAAEHQAEPAPARDADGWMQVN